MVTTTFALSGAVLLKAGKNNNILSGSNLYVGSDFIVDKWITQAEGVIVSACRYDFITNYSSLLSGAKLILEDAASSLAAIYVVAYDMSKYSSRVEAEDIINVQRDAALRDIAILRDKKVQDFIIA